MQTFTLHLSFSHPIAHVFGSSSVPVILVALVTLVALDTLANRQSLKASSLYIFRNSSVENWESPRGEKTFSTWRRFDSSEVSIDSSEEIFLAYVKNKKYPRGELRFSTWISV